MVVAVVCALCMWIAVGITAPKAWKAWRDPEYAVDMELPATRYFSTPAAMRGQSRGVVLLVGTLFWIAVFLSMAAVAAAGWLGGSVGAMAVFGSMALFMLCFVLLLTVVWFNQPRFLGLPSMRTDVGTVVAWWRRKHAAKDQA